MADQRDARKYLSIYLRDHLASAVAGTELARRLRQSEGDGELGRDFEALLAEIGADRRTLEGVMNHLGITPSDTKKAAAWVGEKLGRLKLNGRVVRRSPLSRVLELEGLAMGVTGKRSLWESLEATPHHDELPDFDFGKLIERADDQLGRLRELHRAAAEQAFSTTAPVH